MRVTGPLSGVVVLDLTRLLPGAFATLMLAELGADVIKIEDPNGGDPMRRLPPLVGGRGLYHLLLDRGKKSVAIDLRDAAGRDRLDRLIARADVVVESFRPGTARRLGVAGDQIRARHPRVIHCAITGYGQSGPYAERPGHDLNYVSIAGLLAADRPQLTELPQMFIADVGGGAMTSVIGILAALFGRERSGEGATLDISMHDAAMYWLMVPAARDLVDGGSEAVGDLPTSGTHACYNVYRTRDGGQIALGALEPKFWLAFCDAVGRGDLRPRHLTAPDDQAALIAEVSVIFASRTRDEWLAFFADHDVCITPVHSPAEAFADPHAVARGVVAAVPGGRTIRPPFLREAVALAPAPTLGQDTEETLERNGCSR
jgi:crotonobetainyl-CoA:carnitine CoA-transferase CaiB-like acyl-CoA transferase